MIFAPFILFIVRKATSARYADKHVGWACHWCGRLQRNGRPVRFGRLCAASLPVLALVALVGYQTAVSAKAHDFRSQTPHAAVARIVVPEGAATSYGSGTLVDVRDSYGLVITNWHVVRDATGPIEVIFPNGQRSQARALKVDADWDLAALVIWRPEAQPVALATGAPQPGDHLTICGYGDGTYRSASGRCTGYYAPHENLPQQMVELDVQARQGDSGGPIFNDRGEMAGVLFGAGRGTTLGSYNGRVGTFLATLAPDIGRGVDANERPAPTSSPIPPAFQVANEDSNGASNRRDDQPWQPARERVAAMWDEAAQHDEESPEHAGQPAARPTGKWLAHVKSVLAAIGVVAVVVQILRAAR